MNEAASFQAFFNSIKLDSLDEYQDTIDSIDQKLCSAYYEQDDASDHGVVVGSVGRGTAVSGTSDLDMLFVLPPSVFRKFDSYDSNNLYFRGMQSHCIVLSAMKRDKRLHAVSCADSIRFFI